jgi:pyridoxal phosphate enzyme (YggS family)
MSIKENIISIKNKLPKEVTLVVVSKTKPITDIMEAYNAGQRIFGENKIQEMTQKWQELPKDIEWHMIGHVQTNKVKEMAPYVSLIHSVDSLKLLQEINHQAHKNNRIINCLLQINIAEEESKFGIDFDEIDEIIEYVYDDEKAPNIQIVGVMGMATNTNDKEQLEMEFGFLIHVFTILNTIDSRIETKSFGMSNDYLLAVENGSNMVRIGSMIFGQRIS